MQWIGNHEFSRRFKVSEYKIFFEPLAKWRINPLDMRENLCKDGSMESVFSFDPTAWDLKESSEGVRSKIKYYLIIELSLTFNLTLNFEGRIWGLGKVTFSDHTNGFPKNEGFFQDCKLIRKKHCPDIIQRSQKIALMARVQCEQPV